MDVRVGLWRKQSAEELVLLICGVGEDSWESLDCKEIQLVHPKGDQSWVFIGRSDAEAETLATWCEELTHLKRPWCWERLKAGEEGHDRGWDGWMASLTRWTLVWVDSGSWWWTGKPGMLRFMGSQRVGHDWVTELNWTEYSPDTDHRKFAPLWECVSLLMNDSDVEQNRHESEFHSVSDVYS